jgi:hypothetical protein
MIKYQKRQIASNNYLKESPIGKGISSGYTKFVKPVGVKISKTVVSPIGKGISSGYTNVVKPVGVKISNTVVTPIGKGISSGYTNYAKPVGNKISNTVVLPIGKGISSGYSNYAKPVVKGILPYFFKLFINVFNYNENLTSIIYVMITILLIAHIILFINATIKLNRYSDIENDKSFFNNYPDFEYLKDDYLMEIDAFFLNHKSPFPYIFIFYPLSLYLFYQTYNSTSPTIEPMNDTYIWLISFILLFSVGYFISFNTFHYFFIKPKIDELRETIKKHIIELEIITNTATDMHKNNRGDFLNILKDIIIYEIDHRIPYEINNIADKVLKQMVIIAPEVKLDNVKKAINAGNTDVTKINILKIIYTYQNPDFVGKYFSLLINETYNENKVSYSLYYILGKCKMDYLNNVFDEPFNGIFKGLISDLDDTFRNYLNDYTKRYYIILVSFSSLLFTIFLWLYRSNIKKVLMDFSREYQVIPLLVLLILYLAIILSFVYYHIDSENILKWVVTLISLLVIITVIIFKK